MLFTLLFIVRIRRSILTCIYDLYMFPLTLFHWSWSDPFHYLFNFFDVRPIVSIFLYLLWCLRIFFVNSWELGMEALASSRSSKPFVTTFSFLIELIFFNVKLTFHCLFMRWISCSVELNLIVMDFFFLRRVWRSWSTLRVSNSAWESRTAIAGSFLFGFFYIRDDEGLWTWFGGERILCLPSSRSTWLSSFMLFKDRFWEFRFDLGAESISSSASCRPEGSIWDSGSSGCWCILLVGLKDSRAEAWSLTSWLRPFFLWVVIQVPIALLTSPLRFYFILILY